MIQQKELLELAAVISPHISSDGLGNFYNVDKNKVWNPLDDDEDALQLLSRVVSFHPYLSKGGFRILETSVRAIRLKIVRAAAEIGKTIK